MHPVSTIDYHTAGEPFRIVVDGAPPLPGATVAARRASAIEAPDVQAVRQLLCSEPRGHADMYGGFLTPPDDAGADFGVLFWHKDGFSTACGHGTIALGVWALEHGVVAGAADGVTDVRIDVPSGRVAARVRCTGGVPQAVIFRNVPSVVVDRGVNVDVPGVGRVVVDVAFSGAIYASVAAAAVGRSVRPEDLDALIAHGRAIKRALADHPAARHPDDERLSGIYGVIFHDDLGEAQQGLHQRNVTVFADGEVDRSPCGSGTSARLTLLHDEGRLAVGDPLWHESIVGTFFTGRVVESAPVITEVEGMAHQTGQHRFVLRDADPVGTGFVLR